MGTGTDLAPRVRRRVGAGIVELVQEQPRDRSLATMRDNLASHVSQLLVAIILAAQVADVVTTVRGLATTAYIENNPLLRELILRSPLAAYAVKLLTVTALVLLVLSRLRGRRANVALAMAAAISLIAPVLNFRLLMHL